MAELLDDGLPGRELYDEIEEVGHGRFSEVYKAREKVAGRMVALKHMTADEPGQLPDHIQQEIAALRTLNHPNVVSLLGWHQKGIGVALVLEYCITDLGHLLRLLEHEPLAPSLVKSIMHQLLKAIGACHQAGFMHRDISPSNVLVAEGTGLIKLGDFGLALSSQGLPSDGQNRQTSTSLSHQVGTRWYKAPELMFSSRSYAPAVDLWSAGCIFAEMLAGQPLFPGNSDIDQICRMNRVLGSIREEAWPGVRDLPDWGKLAFPEVKGTGLAEGLPGAPPSAVRLLEGLLQYNPERRLSAEAALADPYFQDDPPPASPQALATLAQQLLSKHDEPEHFQLPASFQGPFGAFSIPHAVGALAGDAISLPSAADILQLSAGFDQLHNVV